MTNDIINIYKSTDSLQAVHKETGLSIGKIRKVLITHGLYHSEIGDEIQKLHDKGLSVKEISKKVKRGESCINSYLPYVKGEYNTEKPSANAIRVRKCRYKKIRKMKEKKVHEKI